MNIGQRIKTARENKGLSQSELARRLGITPQSVQQWESDETSPRGKRLRQLGIELGVAPEWIVFGDKAHPTVEEPPANYLQTLNDDLLIKSSAVVKQYLNEKGYPPRHPAWDDSNYMKLVAIVYDDLRILKGRLDEEREQEIRQRIDSVLANLA